MCKARDRSHLWRRSHEVGGYIVNIILFTSEANGFLNDVGVRAFQ